MLDRQQKWVCRTVTTLLAVSLEPLTHGWNLVCWSFSVAITFVDVHLNWLNWFHYLIFVESFTVALTDYMIFLSVFLYVIRMSLSTVSFLAQLRLWKCLAVECFPFSYDLKGFKFTINSHLLSLGSVLTAFLYAFNLLGLVNLNLKKCNHEFFEKSKAVIFYNWKLTIVFIFLQMFVEILLG